MLHIPDEYPAVVSTAVADYGQQVAIGTECHITDTDAIRVGYNKGGAVLALPGHVPESDRAVDAAGDHRLPIRSEGHLGDCTGMPDQWWTKSTAASHIP